MAQLAEVLYLITGALAAITLHESIKALVSYKLGDPLPKARGRLTLNPINHFEPIGFICMILTGYGWGKPVPTAAIYYKDRKKGTLLTYISPSIANLLAGVSLSFLAHFVLVSVIYQNIGSAAIVQDTFLNADSPAQLSERIVQNASFHSWGAVYRLLQAVAKANVAIAFFNIIPVYPLDGAKILALRLSPEQQIKSAAYEKIFQILLILAMFTGWVGMLLRPLQNVFIL